MVDHSQTLLCDCLYSDLHFSQGWYGVRRELKIPMFAFLALSVGYLAGWAAMFDSIAFRWTFVTWTFFGVMASASVFLTLVAFILGIICRVNFGKGLIRYREFALSVALACELIRLVQSMRKSQSQKNLYPSTTEMT
jgi:hypothetical protein